MKDLLTDANFPRTADQRVYHLGLRPGEIANRIITVGSPSRARRIAANLDAEPKVFTLSSERGFLTITGRYHGVPISIVSIGMGTPNMDFFVREVRECIAGDLAIIRVGSCGALVDVPVGSITVPKACICVNRNVDYDFRADVPDPSAPPPYQISKPVAADKELHETVLSAVKAFKPQNDGTTILEDAVNASADSFYSSQGRQTSFSDHNADLIPRLLESTEDLKTLEMETHHLYHLAAIWGRRIRTETSNPESSPAPLTAGPVSPSSTAPPPPLQPEIRLADPSTVIRAAAVQIIFASRVSQDFITPDKVAEAEEWTGKAILTALVEFSIDPSNLHPEQGTVWEL